MILSLKTKQFGLHKNKWLNCFGVKIPAINKHLNNIYNEGELNKNSTISILEIVQKEGKRDISRNVAFYNLDAIISVGYRVNSSRATQFRIWATNTLKEYITKGYAINEKMLKSKQEQIQTLQSTINILTRSIENQIETVDEAQNVAKILDNFAKGLNLLDNFDHKALYKNNLPIIDSNALFALTLLIAESKPEEMEIMKQIVISVLNK